MGNLQVNNIRHAIHIYQCSLRDRDMPYAYPIENLCSEHGTSPKRSFYVLRDELGYVATVTKDGVVS
jgi:hypothetical protein